MQFFTHTLFSFCGIIFYDYGLIWQYYSHSLTLEADSPIKVTQELECVSVNKYYITMVLVFVFYIPILIMAFLYRQIYMIAHRHTRLIKDLHSNIGRHVPVDSHSQSFQSSSNSEMWTQTSRLLSCCCFNLNVKNCLRTTNRRLTSNQIAPDFHNDVFNQVKFL